MVFFSNGALQPFSSFSHSLNGFDTPALIAENHPSNLVPEGLSWNQEMTLLYGVSNRDGWHTLFTIDASTGISSLISTITGLGDNQSVQGIAIDQNGKCFIISTDNIAHNTSSFLYECNLNTGELTFIGSQSTAPDIHGITASCDDVLYATDGTQGNLYTLNKQNSEVSLIGHTGYDNNKSFYSMTYDRFTKTIYQYVLYDTGYHTAFSKLDETTGDATPLSENYNFGRHIGAIKSICNNQNKTFKLNPGFNGSWYNPDTGGQGFLIDILPDSNTFFAAWFTFSNDSETKSGSGIGSPEHRWFTAQGELGDDNTVSLGIYNTSGGIFNNPTSVQSTSVGTMNINFDDCSSGTIDFSFDNTDLNGSIPIQRIANDNISLCENLLDSEE